MVAPLPRGLWGARRLLLGLVHDRHRVQDARRGDADRNRSRAGLRTAQSRGNRLGPRRRCRHGGGCAWHRCRRAAAFRACPDRARRNQRRRSRSTDRPPASAASSRLSRWRSRRTIRQSHRIRRWDATVSGRAWTQQRSGVHPMALACPDKVTSSKAGRPSQRLVRNCQGRLPSRRPVDQHGAAAALLARGGSTVKTRRGCDCRAALLLARPLLTRTFTVLTGPYLP